MHILVLYNWILHILDQSVQTSHNLDSGEETIPLSESIPFRESTDAELEATIS
jgi:hypothetical protein